MVFGIWFLVTIRSNEMNKRLNSYEEDMFLIREKREPKQLHTKKSSDILQEITVGQALWFATWRDFFPTIWRSLITSLVGFLQRFLRFAQTAAMVVSRRLAQASIDYEFVQNFEYFCKCKNKN